MRRRLRVAVVAAALALFGGSTPAAADGPNNIVNCGIFFGEMEAARASLIGYLGADDLERFEQSVEEFLFWQTVWTLCQRASN